jgi:RNA polymerase sigma factor (sigma-70 family)
MSSTDDRFEALLAAARRGDDDAWRELYLAHAPAVLGYLRSQRAPMPEDLLGEVWLQAVRDLDRFDGTNAGLRSWLLAIAHHRLLDARRSAARRPIEVDSGAAAEAVGPVTVHEQVVAERELLQLLDGLPDSHRELLYLRYVLDLSQQDVARVMGVSTPAAKMLQSRALRSLRRRVAELGQQAAAGPIDGSVDDAALPSADARRSNP